MSSGQASRGLQLVWYTLQLAGQVCLAAAIAILLLSRSQDGRYRPLLNVLFFLFLNSSVYSIL